MCPDYKKDEEMIFYAALKITDKDKQDAFLKETCGNDIELLNRIKILLKSSKQDNNFLKTPPIDQNVTLTYSPVNEGPGTKIGRYKLLEKIGEGGMATVYMAEQEEPVHRRVAMKIIKLGMDSRSVVARFEAERQALAMMDHPNIAKVFDAGITESGRPYFIMELVRGVVITEFCDKNKLSMTDRLDLFLQVCRAVQHAHQKGIIHRDIKPSNVMVTLHDGKPQAVVIDFGIAKATSQKLTEKTLFTRYAQMIGTPEYMSPEQAEMTRLDVDTRSDIYSLGVLLYELLTGSTPFSGEQLREAGYAAIQRIICETDPPKPSTKLSTLGQTLSEVAQHRRTTAQVLPKLVRGDLDWIVMKAMEKERTRRYETTHALIQDIERHLSNQPIAAGPPRPLDRCRKFVRRNRPLVIGAAAVGIVLLAGVVVSTRFAIGQAHALKESQQIADRNRAIATFLERDVFGLLNPWRDGGRKVQIEELLDNASRRAEDSFGGQPLVEASIRTIIGTTYQRLGKYEEAEPHLLRALALRQKLLGDHDPATLATKLELGKLLFFSGREPEAEPIFAEVLSDSREALGTRHETTIEAMSYRASVYLHADELDNAAKLQEDALKLAQEVPMRDDELKVTGMLVLGTVRSAQGRYEEAEKLLKAGLESKENTSGPKIPNIVHFTSNLASLYVGMHRMEDANVLSQNALDTARATLENTDRGTLTALCTRAHVCMVQGDLTQAEKLLIEARDIYKQQKSTARYWFSPEGQLGQLYFRMGHYEEAESCLRQTRNEIYAKWGTRAGWPFYTWMLGNTEQQLGRQEESRKLFSELLDVARKGQIDVSGIDTPGMLIQVARELATDWRPERRDGTIAVQWATKACELTKREIPSLLLTLAAAHAEAGDFDSAVKCQNEAGELLKESQAARQDNPLLEQVKANYTLRLKLYESGKPLRTFEQSDLLELVAAVKQGRVGVDTFELPQFLNAVAWILATDRREEFRDGARAIEWAKKASKLTDEKIPDILDTLAAAYAEAGSFDEAVEQQNKALSTLGDTGPKTKKMDLESRLELYKKGQPYREPESPNGTF